MSLINQMLKDLEARRAPALDDAEGEFRGLAWSGVSERAPSRSPLLFGVGLAAGLAVFGGAGAWLWQGGIPAQLAPPVPAIENGQLDVSTARSDAAQRAPGAEPPTRVSTDPVLAPAGDPEAVSPDGEAEAGASAPEPREQTVSAPAVNAPIATTSAAARPEEADPPAASPERSIEAEADGSPAQPAAAADKKPLPDAGATNAAPAQGTGVRKIPRPPTPEQQAAAAYERGHRALAGGDPRAAEGELRRALEHRPDHRRAREALVGLLVDSGRLVEARDLLEEGIRRHPDQPRFVRVYGRILAEQGQSAAAIAALERGRPALDADPDYHALLAALYQREGRHRRAERLYRGLVGLRPDRGAWWAGLGISLEAQGEREHGRDAFARALRGRDLSPALRDYVKSRLSALDRR